MVQFLAGLRKVKLRPGPLSESRGQDVKKAGGVREEYLFPKGFNLQIKKDLQRNFGANRVGLGNNVSYLHSALCLPDFVIYAASAHLTNAC